MAQGEEAQSSPANGAADQADGAPKSVLPTYKRLVVAAAVPNAVAIAAALATVHWKLAESLFAGLLEALVMYAGIYAFVNGASDMLLQNVGGRARVQSKAFMPQFALVAVGKFIAVGALLAAMYFLLHVNLLQSLIGFFIAQIAITLACVRSLAAQPLMSRQGRGRR